MVRSAGNVLSSPDSSPHLEESSVISPLMSSSSCAEVFMPQSFTFLLQQIPSREARVSSCFNFFSLLLALESYCLLEAVTSSPAALQVPAAHLTSDWSDRLLSIIAVTVRAVSDYNSALACFTAARMRSCASFAHVCKMRFLAQNEAPYGSRGPTHCACSACRQGRPWVSFRVQS